MLAIIGRERRCRRAASVKRRIFASAKIGKAAAEANALFHVKHGNGRIMEKELVPSGKEELQPRSDAEPGKQGTQERTGMNGARCKRGTSDKKLIHGKTR